MFPTNNAAAIHGTGFVCERVVGEPIDVRYYLWHSIYDPQLEFNRSNCSRVFPQAVPPPSPGHAVPATCTVSNFIIRLNKHSVHTWWKCMCGCKMRPAMEILWRRGKQTKLTA